MSSAFDPAIQYMQQAASGLSGQQDAFGGIQNAGDVKSIFGIKNVSDIYAPIFKTLAANKASTLRGAALHSGRDASPDMTYSNIEQGAEDQQNNLLGQEAGAENTQSMGIANMLQGIKGEQNQFGLQKNQALGQLGSSYFQNMLGKQNSDFQTRKPGFGDYLTSILGTAAKVGGAALGMPSTGFGGGTEDGGGGGEWQAGDNWGSSNFKIPGPR